MVSHGLIVRLQARHGSENQLEEFLVKAVPAVQREPATSAWFAVRFGRGEYGIVDAFPNEAGRAAHLAGAVAAALMGQGRELLEGEPRIEKVGILASKLPAEGSTQPITRGLLLTFKAHKGHEEQVKQFLRSAQPLVEAEPGTVAWFALELAGGEYGIFDVFPDNGARFSHLTGQVPRELTKHALSLLGGLPDMDMLQVLASHFATRTSDVGLGVD
jgi:quinol monooxygenase YgiN